MISPPEYQNFEAQIFARLGEVQGTLGTLTAQMSHLMTEHQRSIEKLDSLAIKGAEVDRLSPLVDKHEMTHQRGVGVGRFISAAWLAFAGMATSVFTWFGTHWLSLPR